MNFKMELKKNKKIKEEIIIHNFFYLISFVLIFV